MPVVAAERSARETELHDVEELAPACIHLDRAVVKQVVSAADAGRDFLTPVEIDIGEPGWVKCRVVFMIEPETRVDRQAARTNCPGILQIEGLVRGIREAGVGHLDAAGKEVAVLTLEEAARVGGLDSETGRGTRYRSVADAPVEIDNGRIGRLQHVIALQ